MKFICNLCAELPPTHCHCHIICHHLPTYRICHLQVIKEGNRAKKDWRRIGYNKPIFSVIWGFFLLL
ncbi:hypothetical protein E1A91_D02G092000v1 [Gossypium mustelinum]|uniref:Uncharacterized protein n=1 Tax=Gossypium mustelinum TaxID=34275 RepID=A0A5D2VU89_GOSMU|nr:hypothetical protein E1A91_D02G092000v1 [Gossypium mustelinum]